VPKRERLAVVRCIALSSFVAAGMVVWTGCPSPNNVLRDLAGEVLDSSTLNIRIVNQSEGKTEELDLRIDGALRTFTCDADAQICNFSLGAVPSRVEAVEERRLDDEGAFTGGRDFEGQSEFTFTQDDFQAGSTIVYQLGEDSASAFVL